MLNMNWNAVVFLWPRLFNFMFVFLHIGASPQTFESQADALDVRSSLGDSIMLK